MVLHCIVFIWLCSKLYQSYDWVVRVLSFQLMGHILKTRLTYLNLCSQILSPALMKNVDQSLLFCSYSMENSNLPAVHHIISYSQISFVLQTRFKKLAILDEWCQSKAVGWCNRVAYHNRYFFLRTQISFYLTPHSYIFIEVTNYRV